MMHLKYSSKLAATGVLLLVLGILLNETALHLYYMIEVANAGNPPHSIAPLRYTFFIALVPIGVILLIYAMYLRVRARNPV